MVCTFCCAVKALNTVVFKVKFLRSNWLFPPRLLSNNITFSGFQILSKYEKLSDQLTINVYHCVHKRLLMLLSTPYLRLFFRFSVKNFKPLLRYGRRGLNVISYKMFPIPQTVCSIQFLLMVTMYWGCILINNQCCY